MNLVCLNNHDGPEFKSSAMLVNSQLRFVGFLNSVKFDFDQLFQAFARPY